jgi:hypothetical protein
MNRILLSFLSAIFSLSLLFSISEAADWAVLGKNNLGTVYYDKYGVTQLRRNVVRTSAKITYSPDGVKNIREAFPFIPRAEKIGYTVYTYEVRCYEDSFRIIRATTYSASGKAIKGTDLDYVKTAEASWDRVTPNSLLSHLSEKSCRYLLLDDHK